MSLKVFKKFTSLFVSLSFLLMPVTVVLHAPVHALAATTPMVAGGDNSSFALKSDGTVWGWGSNSYGGLGDGTTTNRSTPVQVSGLSGVTAVINRSSHSLALKSDGTVWAWGYNYYGQLGDGTTTNKYTPVQVSGLTGVMAVAGGIYHSLALKSDGTVWAWGQNLYGQLGNGNTTNSSTPVQVSGLTGVTTIAAGNTHSLALKSDGTVWAWGRNDYGQLGDGTATNRSVPVQVSGLTGVTAIAGGNSHSLALKSDGTVWAWGLNSSSQLGDGTTTTRYTPVQVNGLSGVTSIASGIQHNYALKSDGTVWAWGYNGDGQLGDGTTTTRSTPVQVSGLSGVTTIASGAHHALALKPDGTIWAWGDNTYSQLGDGTTTDKYTPVQVSNFNVYAQVTITTSTAGTGTGTVTGGGTVLSGTSVTLTATPASGSKFVSWTEGGTVVSTSATYTFTAIADRTLVANFAPITYNITATSSDTAMGTVSGEGVYNSGASVSLVATPVAGYHFVDWKEQAGVTAIASGSMHSLALKSDGTVWACGDNGYGQLGNGTTTDRSTPVQVSGLTEVTAIASGYGHSLALKSDGTIWAWGRNNNGQLGDGTTTNRYTPVQVNGLTGVTAIAGGGNSGYALKSDGTVWAWGYNYYGQLGNNSTTDSHIPVQVSGLTGVTAIAGGGVSGYALKSDGTVWAGGANGYGQLGDGTTTSRLTPVQVSGLAPTLTSVSTSPTYTFTASADRTLVANFAIDTFTITASSANTSQGGVTGGGTYDYGAQAALTATPATGYRFVEWQEGGTSVSTNATYSFVVTGNRTLVAIFAPSDYTITVSSANPSMGSVTGGGSHSVGSSVTVTATPVTGYQFVRWTESGSQVSVNAAYTFTANADRTLVAEFAPLTYTITANPSNPAQGSVTGGGVKNFGEQVTLVATPAADYRFVAWKENGVTASLNPTYTLTVTGDRVLIAEFATSNYTITVNPSDPMYGSVTGGGTYTYNAQATLTATPNTGYKFVGWTENGITVSAQATSSLTVTRDRVLVAKFIPISYLINVRSNDTTIGSAAGSGTFGYNESVTVTATPSTGYTFTGWTENSTPVSTSATYTFTATANRNLVANFAPTPTNPTWEKTQYGTYKAAWTGPETATVELKQAGVAKYTANGRFSYAVFLNVAPGVYDLFIAGVDMQKSVTVDAPPAPTTNTTTPTPPTNPTWEKTQYGSYKAAWVGPVKATVELKQAGVTKYTANGNFNYAVFLNAVPGSYDLFIAGTDMQKSVTVDAPPAPTTNTTTPTPATNPTWEKTQYGSYKTTWTGPATATVELKQNGAVKYTRYGTFNYAVFLNVAPGTYDLFIAGTDMQQSVTVDAPTTTTTTTPTVTPPTDPTWEKTQYGTYKAGWTGPAKATVELKQAGITKYTANGTFNYAIFLNATPGTYDLFIAGTDMQMSVTVDEPQSTTTTTTVTPPSNPTWEKTQYGSFKVTWEGPKAATVELKQNGVVKYTRSGNFNYAIFLSVTPGTYDLFIAGTDMQYPVTIQ